MPSEAQPSDEYAHDPNSKPDWKESYYFQFFDPKSQIAGLFYISAYPNVPKRDFLVAFLYEGQTDTYINTLPVGGKLDTITDDKLTFTLIEPNKHWRIHLDDNVRYAQLDFHARFPTYVYDSEKAFTKDVIEQEHYEQPCTVTGFLQLADGTEYKISCFGHRDHSWGHRDYAGINEWFWVAAQFPRCTIGLIKLIIGTKIKNAGFMSTQDGVREITDIQISTQYEEDGFTPESFKYRYTDDTGQHWLLKSRKIQTMVYPPRQAKAGYRTDIYEIISQFMLKKYHDSGYGIAEYLITRKTV